MTFSLPLPSSLFKLPIVMPLVLIMKDKVEELSNIGIKTFAIGTGDEEVIDEGATTGGDRTVGESFGFCCPGVGISNHLVWIRVRVRVRVRVRLRVGVRVGLRVRVHKNTTN